MTPVLMFLLDLIAIGILAFGIYFPRHHRRDMLVALVGVNVGLLAVTAALSSTDLSMGIGFGLFAVLSIIRLRSSEVDQQEVAYRLLWSLGHRPVRVSKFGTGLAALFPELPADKWHRALGAPWQVRMPTMDMAASRSLAG